MSNYMLSNTIAAGNEVMSDLAPLLRGSDEEEAKYYHELVSAGLLTLNEARGALGITALADGDAALRRAETGRVVYPLADLSLWNMTRLAI